MATSKRAAASLPKCDLSKPAPKWLMQGALYFIIALVVILVLILAYRWWKNRSKEGFEDDAKDGEEEPGVPEERAKLIFLYMNNCTWCEKFAPVWAEFEDKYGDALFQMGVKLAKFEKSDADAEEYMSHVKGFPTVMLVKYQDDKDSDEVVMFEEDRTPEKLMEFVKREMGDNKEGFYDANEPTEFGQLIKSVAAAKKAADDSTGDAQGSLQENSGGKLATSGGK